LVHGSSMNPTADLDRSLAFVVGRIEEEATRSGEPPSDNQRFLLNHLPNNSALPIWNGADPESPAVPIPRDAAFERLCSVARAAQNSDGRLNPASTIDWEFAVAVLKLNRHPMSWLLRWAGMKERRPWWDRWLLVVAALLVTFCFAALMLIAGSDPWSPFQWTGIGAGYAAILILLYFVSRWIEERQLRQTIERWRRGPTLGNTSP
jgi:hypothetical protein